MDECGCGSKNSIPRIWHNIHNHLCRYHNCARCNEASFADLIVEAESYLEGYNEIFPNGEQA
jgi:hypothetical protein